MTCITIKNSALLSKVKILKGAARCKIVKSGAEEVAMGAEMRGMDSVSGDADDSRSRNNLAFHRRPELRNIYSSSERSSSTFA